jgi:Leucine-rich repeat (LRR) protein
MRRLQSGTAKAVAMISAFYRFDSMSVYTIARASSILWSMLWTYRTAFVNSSASNLNLWKRQLGCIPEYVWEHTELQTLVLAENGLTELSGQIGSLKRLRMLDLGHNLLTRLPEELSELDGLSDFLYLHDNRLTSLPDSLEQLTKLRYLNISQNEFEVFPQCISNMSGLIELRISDNDLISLPDSVGRLSQLRELHLRNNKLVSLPESIGNLPELRQLDLRGNLLTHLPHTIKNLPKLDKLDLRWVDTLICPGWLAELESRGCAVYR